VNRQTSAWDRWRDAGASAKVPGAADIAVLDGVAQAIQAVGAGARPATTLDPLIAQLRPPPWERQADNAAPG